MAESSISGNETRSDINNNSSSNSNDAIWYVNNNNTDFPDDKDDSGDNDFSNAIPWREVQEGTWLRIMNTGIINTKKYGKSTTIQLQRRDGSYIKAWATSLIAKNVAVMEEKMKIGHGNRLYIKSVGKKTCKDGVTIFYDFRIKLMLR